MTSPAPRPRHRWYAAFYARVIEPSDRKALGPLRKFAAGGAHGRVLEPGAGTGGNLDHYDWSRVERLDLAEPDPFMRQHLEPKLAALPAGIRDRVHLSDAPAEALPFDDAIFDCAVVTLVLCSVADTTAALSELRRVLKPSGELRLIEHVAADGAWGTVQRIVQPVYGWMSGECQLRRDTESLLREGGFEVTVTERPSFGPMWPAFAGTATRR
jgi:SAM-dependent methyltransferase